MSYSQDGTILEGKEWPQTYGWNYSCFFPTHLHELMEVGGRLAFPCSLQPYQTSSKVLAWEKHELHS